LEGYLGRCYSWLMIKQSDDQIVSMGVLKSTLSEAFITQQDRLGDLIATMLAVSEKHIEKGILYSVGIMIDNKIKASEARTKTFVETAIRRSEENTAKLIIDLTSLIDERFDRLEIRVDNHSIRLDKLETQSA
jgi:hypothetical protein